MWDIAPMLKREGSKKIYEKKWVCKQEEKWKSKEKLRDLDVERYGTKNKKEKEQNK